MSTPIQDPIAHAVRLLRETAEELKSGHTLAATGHDWTGEPEAKAAYDEHHAVADALEQWESAIGAGGVEPLRSRQCLHQIAEPVGEHPPQVTGARYVADYFAARGHYPSLVQAFDAGHAMRAQAPECNAMSIILTDNEVEQITGYKRASEQIPELHRQGFYRARRSKTTGDVILERAHYDAICAAGHAANDHRAREPMLRKLKAV